MSNKRDCKECSFKRNDTCDGDIDPEDVCNAEITECDTCDNQYEVIGLQQENSRLQVEIRSLRGKMLGMLRDLCSEDCQWIKEKSTFDYPHCEKCPRAEYGLELLAKVNGGGP